MATTNHEMKRMGRHKNLKRYMKYVFKESLISSFSTISVAKTWAEKGWKTFVFLACLIGCIYQTWDFLLFYFSYPTIVNVEESNPFEILWPATTICNNNRISRKNYCKKFNNSCTYIRSERKFCKMYPRFCYAYKGVPKNTSGAQLEEINLSWELMWDMFPNKRVVGGGHCDFGINRVRTKCSYLRSGLNVSLDYSPKIFPFLTPDNKPSFCYTIFSQIGFPGSEDNTFPNTVYYVLDLDTGEEDYFSYDLPSKLYLVLHDRKRLINPYSKGIVLEGGRRYSVFVSMTEVVRLPPPYNTNCTDYVRQWRENGGYGPMTQSECIEYCKLMKTKSSGNCIDEHITYPHYEVICAQGYETTTDEVIKDCSKQCQPACQEYSFKIESEELGSEEHRTGGGGQTDDHKRVLVTFTFRHYRLTRRVYQPKFNDVELFSYIGGYMGMWLGINLVSILDLLESISLMLCYLIRNKIKNNSKK